MPTISQVSEIVYRLRVDDQATAAVQAATQAQAGYNAALDATDQVVTRSTRSAQSLITQYDSVAKSAAALSRAQRDLQAIQAAQDADAAAGGSRQDALGRAYDAASAKVQALTAAVNGSTVANAAAADAAARAAASYGSIADAAERAMGFTQAQAEAQARVNSFAGVQAPTGDASYSSRAADIAAYGVQLDNLRAKYVPLFAAAQTSIQAQADIAAAYRVGAISMDEAVAATDRVTTAYLKVSDAAAKSAQDQRDAAAALGQSIANSYAGVQPTNIRQSDIDYKARAADIAAYGDELDAVRAKYDPVFRASKQYEGALNDISTAQKTGAISASVAEAATTRVNAAFAQGKDVAAAATGAVNQATDAHGRFSLASAGATRELIVLGHEIVSGNYSRIPGSMLVMAERAGGAARHARQGRRSRHLDGRHHRHRGRRRRGCPDGAGGGGRARGDPHGRLAGGSSRHPRRLRRPGRPGGPCRPPGSCQHDAHHCRRAHRRADHRGRQVLQRHRRRSSPAHIYVGGPRAGVEHRRRQGIEDARGRDQRSGSGGQEVRQRRHACLQQRVGPRDRPHADGWRAERGPVARAGRAGAFLGRRDEGREPVAAGDA